MPTETNTNSIEIALRDALALANIQAVAAKLDMTHKEFKDKEKDKRDKKKRANIKQLNSGSHGG